MLFTEWEVWESSLTENQAWVSPEGTVSLMLDASILTVMDEGHPSTWTGWYKRG